MSTQQLLAGLAGKLGSAAQYVAFHRCFAAMPILAPITMFIKAPFGRFSVKSRLNVNGNIAWFCFEIVSPIAFTFSLLGGPLAAGDASTASLWKPTSNLIDRLSELSSPTKILAGLFLIHYANRSTISGLRTPAPRSPIHPIVVLAAVIFNILNGSLMGTWLGGRTSPLTTTAGAVPETVLGRPLFWVGIALWVFGFIGNLVSDEILYNLRKPTADGSVRPRYSVPQGFLYDWPFGGVSFPAYLCEWIEWLGFAIAACAYSPAPALPSLAALDNEALLQQAGAKVAEVTSLLPDIANRLYRLNTYASPPFLFFFAEVATMLPRAIKGHQWYKQKFGKGLPADRKAIIPGVL